MNLSTPTLSNFTPLPQQKAVLKDIRKKFDYKKGVHEVILSGSVGSSKSLVLAHIVTTHCLAYPGARFGIGRLSLPQLKATLCVKIKEHLYNEGVDYRYNEQSGSFKFSNGSTMPALSWSDNNMAKLGSTEFSGFAIEELTETSHSNAYNTLKQRVGRLPHIPEQLLISATNPDSPSHWAYKRLIEKSETDPLINVYYSSTRDNPYLPDTYVKNLLSTLDPKMARRMVDGEWIEITQDVIYYQYSDDRNYKREKYKVKEGVPIHVCWDFNIGQGKPFSLCLFQYINGIFHVFSEVVIEGMRTEDMCDELYANGHLDHKCPYVIQGDCNGYNGDTRGRSCDYDIIEDYFSNYKNTHGNYILFRNDAPRSNPKLRERHNLMNGHLLNSLGDVKLFVYEDAPTVREGLRLTSLKTNGKLVEDDSKSFQHVTTALGYGVCSVIDGLNTGQTTMIDR